MFHCDIFTGFKKGIPQSWDTRFSVVLWIEICLSMYLHSNLLLIMTLNLSNAPAVYISFLEYIGIPFWTCRYASMHEQDKVIYPKYSEQWPYLLAYTMDCVCSKMLNHGSFKFFELKCILNLIENSGLKSRMLYCF